MTVYVFLDTETDGLHPGRRAWEDRFWSHVDVRDGAECWNWLAAKTSGGYGRFRTPKTHLLAHRVSYELSVGPIADGLQLDHLCRNRSCVNPAHLEPVTPRVNTLRGSSVSAVNAVKTHCNHGHPLSGSNLYQMPDGNRACRACRRRARIAYESRRREGMDK